MTTRSNKIATTPEGTPGRVDTSTAPELPLPSIRSLVKATVTALGISIVLLVFVVLPAEYNLDVTGFGDKIGLTRLSGTVPPNGSEATKDGLAGDAREDRVVIEVPPGKGVEYKMSLQAGQKMKYSWEDPEGRVYYDFHGEPEGDTTGFFESYVVSTANKAAGTLTAPFNGTHGWYWKNSSLSPSRITLITSGQYEVVGLQ